MRRAGPASVNRKSALAVWDAHGLRALQGTSQLLLCNCHAETLQGFSVTSAFINYAPCIVANLAAGVNVAPAGINIQPNGARRP